jgi:hypothetical protein
VQKTSIFILFIFGIFIVSSSDVPGKTPVTVHFFESAVCPSCAKAKEFLKEYAPKNDVIVKSYEVRNKHDAVDAGNQANINRLSAMLGDIDRKNGRQPFIYDDTMKAYPFIAVNGVPNYEKRISASTILKKPLPVPVFIIGNRAIAGFQKNLIIRFVDQEKKK